MSMKVADHLLSRLEEWGVRRIYGYPGDGINGILGALGRAGDRFEFIQTRHEEMAAFMACGHAKFTGEVGVCLATSGPGAIHLLNGLYDAKLDHQPVVAIVGQQARMAMGASYQQEVDLQSLFKDVAGDYVHECTVPAQLRQLVDRAIRIALSRRTVTCIIIPNDVQELPAVTSPPRSHGAVYTSAGYTPPRIVPHDRDLRRAADVLNQGSKVAMLVGAGAIGATDDVLAVAERLGAGVGKGLRGEAVVPGQGA
jgi:pyruvate dehydrogenase (quinone)